MQLLLQLLRLLLLLKLVLFHHPERTHESTRCVYWDSYSLTNTPWTWHTIFTAVVPHSIHINGCSLLAPADTLWVRG